MNYNVVSERWLLSLSSLLFFCLVHSTATHAEVLDMQPLDAACTDPDGDGYGWNGVGSCASFIDISTEQTARLIPTDDNIGSFARDVEISGDLMIVGARDSYNRSNRLVSAYVLHRDLNGKWQFEARIESTATDDITVAIDGDTALIGTPTSEINGKFYAGAVSIYRRSSNATWSLETELTLDNPSHGSGFGRNMAISGNTIVVHARSDIDTTKSVYVFRRSDDGQWALETILPTPLYFNNFADLVAVSGDTILVDSCNDTTLGPYVYKRDTNKQWVQVARLNHPNFNKEDTTSCFSVAIDGDLAVVANPYANNGGGLVYLFRETSPGNWKFESILAPEDKDGRRAFANAKVAVSGNSVLVGKYSFSGGAIVRSTTDDRGYLFHQTADQDWRQVAVLSSSVDDSNWFDAISISGNTVAVGSTRLFNMTSDYPGSVYLFDITSHTSIRSNRCIDTDGDGWGWNGDASCRIEPSVLTCVDNDGDGWGWNGSASCRLEPVSSNCIDTDGDGWGWNGSSSCRVNMQETTCFDTPPLGNGWGWNGVASCRVTEL